MCVDPRGDLNKLMAQYQCVAVLTSCAWEKWLNRFCDSRRINHFHVAEIKIYYQWQYSESPKVGIVSWPFLIAGANCQQWLWIANILSVIYIIFNISYHFPVLLWLLVEFGSCITLQKKRKHQSGLWHYWKKYYILCCGLPWKAFIRSIVQPT